MPKVAFECNFWLVFHSALPHEKTETSWTSLRLRFGTGTTPLSFICEPSHSISIAMRLCVPVSVCEWVSVLCVNNNKQMNKWIRLFLLHRVVVVRLRWVIRYSEIDWRPDKTIVTAATAKTATAAATDGCKVLNEAWFPWFAYMLKLISSDSKNENWFVVQWSEFNETFYHLTDFLSLQQKGTERERVDDDDQRVTYRHVHHKFCWHFHFGSFQQFGTTMSRASVSKLNDAVQSISQWQMAMRTLEWSMFLWDLITFGDFHWWIHWATGHSTYSHNTRYSPFGATSPHIHELYIEFHQQPCALNGWVCVCLCSIYCVFEAGSYRTSTLICWEAFMYAATEWKKRIT